MAGAVGELPFLEFLGLAEDRGRQPPQEFGRRESILVGGHFQFRIGQPRKRGRRQQLHEHRFLPVQHGLVNGEVGPHRVFHSPVVPEGGGQGIVEFRGELVGLGTEDLLFEEIERLALFLRLDDRQRRPRVGVAAMIAVNVHAADKACHEDHRPAALAQQHVEGPAGPLVTIAGLHHLVDQPRQDLIDQLHPPLGELDQVFAQVETVHQRIGLGEVGVFVGGELQGRLGAAGGDFRQFRRFAPCAAGKRLVGVFDRPIIIRSDRCAEVVALLLSLGRDVHRHVVHHRGGQARVARLLGVVDFVERQPARWR